MNVELAPNYASVKAARERIRGRIRTTPLVENDLLNKKFAGRLLLKLEPLQISGSFKIRGALNILSTLTDEEGQTGVVAFSSGNHGVAVSAAAALVGLPAVVVMPSDAPKMKIELAREYGAEVILYDRETEDREAICAEIALSRGYALIPPFDDPRIISGQGSIALEIVEQSRELGVNLDVLAVPCSGGGLSSGCAIALSGTSPATELVTVEPEGFDDMRRSLDLGERVKNPRLSGSICDALLVKEPGSWTFPILRDAGARGVAVSDEEVLKAVRVALEVFKFVAEPSGAAALAAVLYGKLPLDGRAIAVICSGGNADSCILSRAISEAL